MLNKEKLLSNLQKDEDRAFFAKILNKVEKTLKNHSLEKSEFLDPHQVYLVDSILKFISDINYKFAGGYSDAERQRILVFPEYMATEQLDTGIECLRIKGNFKFQKVSHRDFLGAILGLGIKREKIGDILVIEDGCQVFVDEELTDYITINLQKIHRVTVKVEKIPASEVILPAEKVKLIETTVTSLRIDVVAGAGFGLSRSQVAKEIAGEKIKLNWGPGVNQAQQVKAGDILSIKGRGRIKVEEVKGSTAKGRIKISIKRFL